MDNNVRWLYAGRALRSFATAFLTVAFPLYLATLGYRSRTIGIVLAVGAVATAALVLLVGIAGDRFGRRRMLVILGGLAAAGGLLMAGTTSLAAIAVASGLGGVGRGGGAGSGGSWGPVFPAEQPLLAASVSPRQRTAAFGRIGFVGVLAAVLGSLVAALPAALHRAGWTWVAAYHLLFLIGGLIGVGIVLVSLPLREVPPPAGPEPEAPPSALSTRQLIGRLGITNALNGMGFGFLGPLLTYWFHVRYGVGSAELGVLYAIVNLASALPYLGAARLTRRFGSVHTVVVTRAFSVVVLALMAVVPTFLVASILLALRTGLNSLGIPARQSYTMGVAEERRRGTVAALGSLPSMVTSSISPVVGGALMGAFLDTPIVGATLFMGVNTVAYYLAFRNTRPPEERTAPGPPAGEEQAAPDVTGGAPRASPGAAPG